VRAFLPLPHRACAHAGIALGPVMAAGALLRPLRRALSSRYGGVAAAAAVVVGVAGAALQRAAACRVGDLSRRLASAKPAVAGAALRRVARMGAGSPRFRAGAIRAGAPAQLADMLHAVRGAASEVPVLRAAVPLLSEAPGAAAFVAAGGAWPLARALREAVAPPPAPEPSLATPSEISEEAAGDAGGKKDDAEAQAKEAAASLALRAMSLLAGDRAAREQFWCGRPLARARASGLFFLLQAEFD